MSFVKDVYVRCDQCGDCEFASPTGTQARREAQQLGGWKMIDGKDYCSRCVAQQAGAVDRLPAVDTENKMEQASSN